VRGQDKSISKDRPPTPTAYCCWASWAQQKVIDSALVDRILQQYKKLSPYSSHNDFLTESREAEYFRHKVDSLSKHTLTPELIAKEMSDAHTRIGLLHLLWFHFGQLKQACETTAAKKRLEVEEKGLMQQWKMKRKQLKEAQEKINHLHVDYNTTHHRLIEQLSSLENGNEVTAEQAEHTDESASLFHSLNELIHESVEVIEKFWHEVEHTGEISASLAEKMALQREALSHQWKHSLSEHHNVEYFKNRLEYRERMGILYDSMHDEMIAHHLQMHIVHILYLWFIEYPEEQLKAMERLTQEKEAIEKLLQAKHDRVVEMQEQLKEMLAHFDKQLIKEKNRHLYVAAIPDSDTVAINHRHGSSHPQPGNRQSSHYLNT
jgi:predicted nuclease with TOPRIM domain